MHKQRQQNKVRQNNRVGTSISVGAENPNEDQEHIDSAPSSGFVPTYEDVQKRAYQIHEEKGGSDLDNWLEAERVLKGEQQVQR